MNKDIELVNVSKVIKKRLVLSNINLVLSRNNIYGLYGRNGSGKTMLIRMIAGLIKPSEGEVFVFGKQIGKEVSFPASVGVTIENIGFWPEYTGFTCLKMLASIKKIIDDSKIKDTMRRVGLEPDDSRKYHQYSLGMKQKLAIAQAIMESPDLIMLDEPTNSLDPQSVESIRNVLIEERERGALVIVASHNKEDLQILSNFSYELSEGKINENNILYKQ